MRILDPVTTRGAVCPCGLQRFAAFQDSGSNISNTHLDPTRLYHRRGVDCA